MGYFLEKNWRQMIRWHVICSKQRSEEFLWRQLCSRGIEVYYPCINLRSVKIQTRKIKPYFPGYLFVHIDLDAVGVSTFQWIPGATRLVCFGGEPAYVPDGLIQMIRVRVDQINEGKEELMYYLEKGDDVEICSGPFSGYNGIFNSYLADRERALIFINYIRDQQVRVELPVDQIVLKKTSLLLAAK